MWCSSHDITCDKSTNQSQKTTRLCFQHLHEQILNRTIGILQQWIHVEADITHTLLKKKQATHMMWSYNDDSSRGKSFPGWEDWLLYSDPLVLYQWVQWYHVTAITWHDFEYLAHRCVFFVFLILYLMRDFYILLRFIVYVVYALLCPQPAQSFCRSYFHRSGVWL